MFLMIGIIEMVDNNKRFIHNPNYCKYVMFSIFVVKKIKNKKNMNSF